MTEQLDALERLAKLRDSGALTEAEFAEQKARLLAQPPTSPAPPRFGDTAETPVTTFRGSTLGWLFGTLAGWATAVLCVAPILLIVTLRNPDYVPIALIAMVVGLAILGWKWLSNLASSYELTNQRLIVRTGLIAKRIDEIELFRVKDVRVDFTLLNQLTGIGQLCLGTSDPTANASDFVMRDVPRARDIRETLRTLVDQARQRRRVREFDVDALA